jgi:gliding motility-associated-like protein
MRFIDFVLLLFCILLSLVSSAQNSDQKRTYRVIAYRNGDTTITSQSNYTDVYPNLSVYIPNAFTPNGDGINDTFGVKGVDIGQFELVIYDRWGAEIFSTSNPNVQWDGKYKGHDAEGGVYAYKFTAMGIGKGETEKSGTVTLVR